MNPASAAYNIPVVLRLSGLLDVPALGGAAVRDVFDRHEVLRTRYPDTDDGPVQEVLRSPTRHRSSRRWRCRRRCCRTASRDDRHRIRRDDRCTGPRPIVLGQPHRSRPGDGDPPHQCGRFLDGTAHPGRDDGLCLAARRRHPDVVAVAGPVRGLRAVAAGDSRRRERSRVHARAAARLLVEPSRRCARTARASGGPAAPGPCVHARCRVRVRPRREPGRVAGQGCARAQLDGLHGDARRLRGVVVQADRYR